MQSPFLRCSADGTFEPLQCRLQDGSTLCECVQPNDGTPIPGSEVTVTDPSEFPDCDAEGQ